MLHISSRHYHHYRPTDTLDTVFHVNICYTRYYSFMHMYHHYTDTNTHDTIISCSWTTDTWILDTVISCASIIVTRTLLYSRHYHFMYCNTVALSLFWHVLLPTVHGYSRTGDIRHCYRTWIHVTEHCYCMYLWTYDTDPILHRYYYYNHISLLHRLTCVYVMITFVFPLH